MQNSTPQFASPQKPIDFQPAFHAKPVSTTSATKQSDYVKKTYNVSKIPGGTLYTPKASTVNQKPAKYGDDF